MDDYDLDTTYVKLGQRHKQFLKKIDQKSIGKAIRILIDSIISGEEQANRKRIMDNTVMWSCFGAIFLFISYLLSPPIQLVSILVGTFLFAYGTIGGAILALSSAKRRRRNKSN